MTNGMITYYHLKWLYGWSKRNSWFLMAVKRCFQLPIYFGSFQVRTRSIDLVRAYPGSLANCGRRCRTQIMVLRFEIISEHRFHNKPWLNFNQMYNKFWVIFQIWKFGWVCCDLRTTFSLEAPSVWHGGRRRLKGAILKVFQGPKNWKFPTFLSSIARMLWLLFANQFSGKNIETGSQPAF